MSISADYDIILDSLGAILAAEHFKKVAPFTKALEAKIDAEDIDGALDLIDTYDLSAAYEAKKAQVLHFNHLAFVFGVNLINPTNKAKSLQSGQPLDIVQISADQVGIMIQGSNATIKAEMRYEIGLLVDDLNTLEYSAQKADIDPKQRILLQYKERLAATSKEGGANLYSLVASLNSARMSSYGFMNEATLVGITHYRYEAMDDSRTTEICNHLDGKVFPVATAYSRLDQELRITDSDQLKAFSPFPKETASGLESFKSMSSDELQALGYTYPPMHFKCRSFVTYVTGQIQIAGLEIPTAREGLSEILEPSEIQTLLTTVGLTGNTINLAKGALAAGVAAITVMTDLAISYESLALIQALLDYDLI